MCTWFPQIQMTKTSQWKNKTEIPRQKSLYTRITKDSEYVEKVVHNEPDDSFIVSDQVSNENIHNSSSNIVFFGDSILKV